jgi:glycosyltransferase involved in cell wall biosynthesis
LTPLGPGGQNGGAGLVATTLVRQFGTLANTWQFDLLTSTDNQADLAFLEAPNVRRSCIIDARPTRLRSARRALLERAVPVAVRARARSGTWRLRHPRALEATRPDLLFCPFTAPYFARDGVKLVAIVHDLQHVAFPSFFAAEQRLNRDQHLGQLAARATRVVCVSEFVRETFVARYPAASARAIVIPHGLLQAMPPAGQSVANGEYVLYPANFWPHKNHRVLFRALAAYRSTNAGRDLRLVCTGAPNAAMEGLRAEADSLFGPGVVEFRGYVAQAQFESLLDGSAALIYPSLYEGFGLPVLEAMARGKPVLCSQIPPLSEVGGDVPIYFDPRDPGDMARALASLAAVSADQERIRRGRERAQSFGGPRQMASKYLGVFDEVLAEG